eukprot:Skav202530  [mRNA]  locus=scaffold2011:110210:133952:- [translate_table: standard]
MDGAPNAGTASAKDGVYAGILDDEDIPRPKKVKPQNLEKLSLEELHQRKHDLKQEDAIFSVAEVDLEIERRDARKEKQAEQKALKRAQAEEAQRARRAALMAAEQGFEDGERASCQSWWVDDGDAPGVALPPEAGYGYGAMPSSASSSSSMAPQGAGAGSKASRRVPVDQGSWRLNLQLATRYTREVSDPAHRQEYLDYLAQIEALGSSQGSAFWEGAKGEMPEGQQLLRCQPGLCVPWRNRERRRQLAAERAQERQDVSMARGIGDPNKASKRGDEGIGLVPGPTFAKVKTSIGFKTGQKQKCFINIVHTDRLDDMQLVKAESGDGQQAQSQPQIAALQTGVHLPYSLSPPRPDRDQKDEYCMTCDFAVSTGTFQRAAQNSQC